MSRILTLLVLAACGGAPARPDHPEPPIARVRREAAAHPRDAAKRRALAIAEVLMDGGEARRAKPAIDAALALAPRDPAVLYVAGLERAMHAFLADAASRWAAAVDAARASADPLAPAIAEAALVALSGLEDEVPRFAATMEPLVERTLSDHGPIGEPVWGLATALAIDRAVRKGDVARAVGLAETAGCIHRWRVAGPLGPHGLLGFDERVTLEGRGPLADSYDLGPGRGVRPTREVDANGCFVQLGSGPVRGPGVWVAESFIEVARAGDQVLRVDTPRSVQVSIDGEVAMRVDRRRGPEAEVHWAILPLRAGRHEIEAKIATRLDDPPLMVSILPAGDEAHAAASRRAIALPEGNSPLEAYLRARLDLGRSDPVAAREVLRDRGRDAPTALLELAADVALADPMTPNDQRQDHARAFLRRAAAADRDAWYPPFRLALLDASELESLRALGEVARRWPDLPQVALAHARAQGARGWDADANETIRRVRRALPDSCSALEAEHGALTERGRLAEAHALVDALVQCRADSGLRLDALVRARRWDDARTELARLEALTPAHLRRGTTRSALSLARAKRDEPAVAEALRRLAGFAGLSSFPIDDADALLARGRTDEAIARLDAELVRDPRGMSDLRYPRRALAGTDELTPWRTDGTKVLRDFEASGRHYDEGQVLVYDSEVVRIYPDGSAVELVHQIHRLQSQESVDALGQVQQMGTFWTLRAIKPDGRRVEPDLGDDESETIHLPGLGIGDYVEWEYVAERDPLPNGGFRGGRFSFRDFEVPFDWSRLVVLVPQGSPVEVDSRGGAPELVESTVGDLRVMRWEVHESRPQRPEPDSVAAVEFLPSIQVAIRAPWEAYFDEVRDGLSDRDRRDPDAARLVAKLLGRRPGPLEARVRALHRWVTQELEAGEDFYGDAPTMVAAKNGHRTRVLRYLLALAGIQSDVLLVRPFGMIEPTSFSDPEIYALPILRIAGEGGRPMFVWAADRGAPVDYLPSSVRGQDAIVVAAGAPRVRLPDRPPETDRHAVTADVRVEADGSASLEIVEEFHGESAVGFRQRLEQIPDAELRRGMEQGYVPRVVPGGSLREFRIEGREDPSRPIVLTFSIDVRAFGRRVGHRLALPPLFPAGLAASYASLPSRTTAEIVSSGSSTVTIRLRTSGRLGPAPPAVHLRGPGRSSYSIAARRRGDALEVVRTVVLERTQVTPADYPAFATFCRRADEADESEISVTLR